MTDSTQTIETSTNGVLVERLTITTVYNWAASPPTVTITVTDDATGQVVATDTQPVPSAAVEQRTYSTNLAAELTAYKADNLAMQTAIQAAVDTIPNNAFTGASLLKTALREISDQSKAQRRMFRAAIRDVAALDDGQ